MIDYTGYLCDESVSGKENYIIYFFFFKQKTAYEMLRSLVGSEMCIRDSESLEYTLQFYHRFSYTPRRSSSFLKETVNMLVSTRYTRAAWKRMNTLNVEL